MATPHSSDSEPDHGFQIAPMVDVVFVLLLFFMALAGVRQIETHLNIPLPTPGPASDLPLVIDIRDSGSVLCNGLELMPPGETADRSGMEEWLRKVGQTEPETPVLIRPDLNAEHGRFIHVMATLNKAGLKKVTFH